MSIEDLIALLVNRLAYLSQQLSTYEHLGDIENINRIQSDIAQTEVTLAQLRAM